MAMQDAVALHRLIVGDIAPDQQRLNRQIIRAHRQTLQGQRSIHLVEIDAALLLAGVVVFIRAYSRRANGA